MGALLEEHALGARNPLLRGLCQLRRALVEPAGLMLALAVLTPLSALAGPQFRWPEVVALTLALIVFSVGIFVYVLGLPLTLWPSV